MPCALIAAVLFCVVLLDMTECRTLHVVNLDHITFNKVVRHGRWFIVKFDVEFPHSSAQPEFERLVAAIATQQVRWIVGEVRLKESDPKHNKEIFDRFNVTLLPALFALVPLPSFSISSSGSSILRNHIVIPYTDTPLSEASFSVYEAVHWLNSVSSHHTTSWYNAATDVQLLPPTVPKALCKALRNHPGPAALMNVSLLTQNWSSTEIPLARYAGKSAVYQYQNKNAENKKFLMWRKNLGAAILSIINYSAVSSDKVGVKCGMGDNVWRRDVVCKSEVSLTAAINEALLQRTNLFRAHEIPAEHREMIGYQHALLTCAQSHI